MARVTILLPTFNRARILGQTLEAIARSDRSGLDLEVVVIDNNSGDDTAACVKSFNDRLPLRLLHESRPGKNCALNRGIQESDLGELVVFVDDDIVPTSNWLQEILLSSKRWPNVSIFGAKVEVGWPEGRQPDWAQANWIKIFGFAWHDLGDREKPYAGSATPMGGCFWVRKEVFSAVPRFDETIGPRPTNRIMGSEVSFLVQFVRRGHSMVYCPSVSVKHQVSMDECTLSALKRRAYRCGRGEIRVFGLHRHRLYLKTKWLWRGMLVSELLVYSLPRFIFGAVHPSRSRRAELVLRAMVRVGKVAESFRMESSLLSEQAFSRQTNDPDLPLKCETAVVALNKPAAGLGDNRKPR